MYLFFRRACLCILFFSFSSAQAIDLSAFPPCDVQACQSVAEVKTWPEVDSMLLKNMRRVEFHGFDVFVPVGAVETRSNYSFRQFDIGQKRWFSLSVFKRDDMDEFFKASTYSMGDWADIVFTQTPDSAVPKIDTQAYAWYSSLMTKPVFVGGNMVTQYIKPPLTVYLIDEVHRENDVLMVVSDKLPNVLLKVEAYGFDRPSVMRFISALSPPHGKKH